MSTTNGIDSASPAPPEKLLPKADSSVPAVAPHQGRGNALWRCCINRNWPAPGPPSRLRKGKQGRPLPACSSTGLRAMLFRTTYARLRIRHGIRHTAARAGRGLCPCVANGRLRHMLIGYARVSKADGSQPLEQQRELPAAVASARSRGRESGQGAFADQLPLKLGHGRQPLFIFKTTNYGSDLVAHFIVRLKL